MRFEEELVETKQGIRRYENRSPWNYELKIHKPDFVFNKTEMAEILERKINLGLNRFSIDEIAKVTKVIRNTVLERKLEPGDSLYFSDIAAAIAGDPDSADEIEEGVDFNLFAYAASDWRVEDPKRLAGNLGRELER